MQQYGGVSACECRQWWQSVCLPHLFGFARIDESPVAHAHAGEVDMSCHASDQEHESEQVSSIWSRRSRRKSSRPSDVSSGKEVAQEEPRQQGKYVRHGDEASSLKQENCVGRDRKSSGEHVSERIDEQIHERVSERIVEQIHEHSIATELIPARGGGLPTPPQGWALFLKT